MFKLSGGAPCKAASTRSALTAPLTGTFTDALGGIGSFAGTRTVNRFTTEGGRLATSGPLTGTLIDSEKLIVGEVTQSLTIAVTASGTCKILHLELGPLHLNLLGWQVRIDQVVLDITAQFGPGDLLGNLLCANAALLDSHASADATANLLDQLLGL